MKTVEVAPRIHNVYPNSDRDEGIRKKVEKWGWHNIHELTDCVNRYILSMWPTDKNRWGRQSPFTATGLIDAFGILNGFHCPSSSEVAEPLLSWASPDFLAIDSPPLAGELFSKALAGKDFFTPAAWGIKVTKLIEQHVVEVIFERHAPIPGMATERIFGIQLTGKRLEESGYLELDKKWVRNLTSSTWKSGKAGS